MTASSAMLSQHAAGSTHGRFQDKVTIVTGGASGMGRETARQAAQEGAIVVIADVREQPLANGFEKDNQTPTAELITKAGGRGSFVKTDMTKLAEIEQLVASTVQQFGRIDILLNFAGINPSSKPLVEMTEQLYDLIFSINVKGCFFLMQHTLRQMSKQEVGPGGSRGKIVNVASINGLSGGPLISAYGSSKHAVVGLTKSAACEHAKDRININAIAPGIVSTSMTAEYVKDPSVAAHFQDKTRWARAGRPSDLAKMALFLASDDAEWITGSIHLVDGGLLAGY